MKAWQDLVTDPEIRMYSTTSSKYWIDKGIRIEKLMDGTVDIKVTLSAGDKFTPPSDDEVDMFTYNGWECGCALVAMNDYKNKLKYSQAKVNYGKLSPEELIASERRVARNLKKVEEYELKLNKCLENS